MIDFVRQFRLIPVVLIAIGSLLGLKTLGLLLDGGYTLGGIGSSGAPASAPPNNTMLVAPTMRLTSPEVELAAPEQVGKQSWAQEIFNFPDVTGSVDNTKTVKEPGATIKADSGEQAKEKPIEPQPGPRDTVVPLDANGRPVSEAERAILERLQQRRQELDARTRELDIRESLLKATEKRVEARVLELKDVEGRINTAMQKKDEVETERFKGLVTMYENMKAKDAARIFDRLDLKVLIEVCTQINPRRMSDILAQMSPEAAERLTVELANRASLNKGQATGDLPKIEGRPNGS